MVHQIDYSAPDKVILERQGVATALYLIDKLVVLVTGDSSRQSGDNAKARHDLACQIVASRRSRVALFPNDIFDEPAWDILLQLYCAIGNGEAMTAKAIGRSISSPSSTIERWVSHLVEHDLIEYIDGMGNVDSQIRLSNNGITRLDAYFRMLIDHRFRV